MPFLRHLAERLLLVIGTLWVALTVVFFAIQLVPGDPAQAALNQSIASEDVLAARRAYLNLDQPLSIQYLSYLKQLASGDLGRSWVSNQSVIDLVTTQFSATFGLALSGGGISILLGIGLGAGVSQSRNPLIRRFVRMLAIAAYSVPIMIVGLWLLTIWPNQLELFRDLSRQRSLLLAAVTIGLTGAGAVAHATIMAIEDTAENERALRARGISPWIIFFRHRFRVALLPIIELVGLQFGFYLSGAVITEILFARSGVGRIVVTAVLNKDLPVLQAGVLWSILAYALILFMVDLLSYVLDPRLQTAS